MITYHATLDVPRELAQYLGRLLHAERRDRGTRTGTRALTCYKQAVLGLRWFRQNTDVDTLARDHGISRATGYRYLDEIVTVLAEQAPDLHEALHQAKQDDLAHVILDGKIFTTDRLAEKTTSVKGTQIDRWYSGKAHTHGGNIQALTAPNGFPLWVSDVEPGSVHDLTAAREHVLGALYWAYSQLDLPTLADNGYHGGASAYSHRSNNPPTVGHSPRTTAPTTPCSAACAASENAASPYSPAAGAPYATSPPAPARPAASSKQPSYSPISNTDDSPESR